MAKHAKAKTTFHTMAALLDEQALALDVFNAVFDATESIEEGNIGSDLAYVMAAVLSGDEFLVEEPDQPIVEILRKAYPDEKHPIWKVVVRE